MKTLFVVFLVLHFLTEAAAAVALIGGPDGVAAAGQGGQWAMHYGFAALAFASISLWVWPQRGNRAAVTVALGALLVFHVAIFTSLAIAGDQPAGMAVHIVLATLGALLFTQRGRLTT